MQYEDIESVIQHSISCNLLVNAQHISIPNVNCDNINISD